MGYPEDLKTVRGGRCTGITSAGVTYQDAEGNEQLLPCGSVVMAAGMRPRQADALALYDPAYRVYTVGDCDKAANVQKAVRAAFAAAISI